STESQLREISALGVGIALDDFGTGYSSFSYLRRFPLNCIKIDKSFVAPLALAESQPGIRIVEAIIGLAHGLGLHVTAEGIETQEQADILRGLDCDRLQGYYFGGPLKAPGVDDVCCSSARFAIAAASESNSTA
ncbi:MAG TPA: EAL domain-containing protein, partial [Usitatibacteraceae bacterium]|nr:EAL domain-containing protein [Usitatibacteraceae bacterium]